MNFNLKEPTFMAWMPVLVIILLVFIWRTEPDMAMPVYNERFLAFGTMMDVSIVGVSEETSENAVHQLEEDFQQMHHLWHAWNPGPLGRVNEMLAKGEAFSAPTSVLPLIQESTKLSVQSEHLFNPAIGKLVDLWGFHDDLPKNKKPPEKSQIQALVEANPKMTDIKIDSFKLSTDNPLVQLDFGAFGKGYGIDQAIETLQSMGIKNAIVNAGGDLRAIGSRAGTPWRIAIKRPNGTGVLGVIKANGDESIFTSGNYERYFDYQGTRYHHIIDPRTGYPASEVTSVTVIHSNATTADAAATALFVAGPSKWHKIASQMGIKYVLMIDNHGIFHMNPAMKKRVEFLQPDNKIKVSQPLT